MTSNTVALEDKDGRTPASRARIERLNSRMSTLSVQPLCVRPEKY